MTLSSAKAILRSHSQARRDAMPAAARAQASQVICQRVAAELGKLSHGGNLFLFATKGSEVDTSTLDIWARAHGFTVCYPRVAKPAHGLAQLTFHACPKDALMPGPFDVPTPPADAPMVPVAQASAIVVPGLAFDLFGRRLGWGKGYYDAALTDDATKHAKPTTLGVAFDCQIVACVPTGPSDIPVNFIITESARHSVS